MECYLDYATTWAARAQAHSLLKRIDAMQRMIKWKGAFHSLSNCLKEYIAMGSGHVLKNSNCLRIKGNNTGECAINSLLCRFILLDLPIAYSTKNEILLNSASFCSYSITVFFCSFENGSELHKSLHRPRPSIANCFCFLQKSLVFGYVSLENQIII